MSFEPETENFGRKPKHLVKITTDVVSRIPGCRNFSGSGRKSCGFSVPYFSRTAAIIEEESFAATGNERKVNNDVSFDDDDDDDSVVDDRRRQWRVPVRIRLELDRLGERVRRFKDPFSDTFY